MYAEPAMVLSDTWSVGTVVTALDGLADRALVVVQRDVTERVTYFALDVGFVRGALENADPDENLASALRLGVFPPNRVVNLDDVIRAAEQPAHEMRPGDVLLRHADVLGVVRADSWGTTVRGDIVWGGSSGGERPKRAGESCRARRGGVSAPSPPWMRQTLSRPGSVSRFRWA